MEGRLHRRKGGGLSFLMGGDGPPLLLLHGAPGSAQSWFKVGVRLVNRFRVIIPDLAGFGMSEPGTDGASLLDQAQAVRNLLHHLQLKTLYVGGHDFGALVALTLLQTYPDLHARGLILAAGNLLGDAQPMHVMRLAALPGLGTLLAGNRWGLRLLYQRAVINQEEFAWADYRRHLTKQGMVQTRRILHQRPGELRQAVAPLSEFLPQLECPALLLWGDEDPLLPVEIGVRLRATLPDALLKVYAYTGHFVPEERPIETAEDIVLRFYQEPPSIVP